MPRTIRGREQAARPSRFAGLVDELAHELEDSRESGQPVIDEQHFPKTGKARVSVLWDKWDQIPHDERVGIILEAYEKVEGREVRENVALAVGLTFPEAYEDGMLPFQVIPILRAGDPVSPAQCREAMIAEGASTLFPGSKIELRFTDEGAAEAARKRLARRLAGSEPIWAVLREVGRIEAVGGED